MAQPIRNNHTRIGHERPLCRLTPRNDYTAAELAAAYRRAQLRRIGVSLLKALESPLIHKSLCLQAQATRDTQALAQRECTRIHTEKEAA